MSLKSKNRFIRTILLFETEVSLFMTIFNFILLSALVYYVKFDIFYYIQTKLYINNFSINFKETNFSLVIIYNKNNIFACHQ